MDSNQLGGILRAVLAWGAGFLVAKGILPTAVADAIVSGLVTIAVAAWSWQTNKPSA